MAVDLTPLRAKYYASTYVSFPNDVRDILDSLKQGNEAQRTVAERLEKLDLNTEEGRTLARAQLSELFRWNVPRDVWSEDEPVDGGRRRRKARKTRRGKKVRRTRGSRKSRR